MYTCTHVHMHTHTHSRQPLLPAAIQCKAAADGCDQHETLPVQDLLQLAQDGADLQRSGSGGG